MTVIAIIYGKHHRKNYKKIESTLESTFLELEQLQKAFGQFAPSDVVEDIISQGVSKRGHRREVTILFADLVGFTAMSESMDPQELVDILNGYFESMTQAIAPNKGQVSKFIGDGILALFGAPDPNPWQAIDAVKAALAMRTGLDTYNKQLAKKLNQKLGLGVGIHKGQVIAGVIGSRTLKEYTVIGDVVNTASRIEGLTRKHKVDILISESVMQGLDESFLLREMPALPVKGKTQDIVTWTVDGIRGS